MHGEGSNDHMDLPENEVYKRDEVDDQLDDADHLLPRYLPKHLRDIHHMLFLYVGSYVVCCQAQRQQARHPLPSQQKDQGDDSLAKVLWHLRRGILRSVLRSEEHTS